MTDTAQQSDTPRTDALRNEFLAEWNKCNYASDQDLKFQATKTDKAMKLAGELEQQLGRFRAELPEEQKCLRCAGSGKVSINSFVNSAKKIEIMCVHCKGTGKLQPDLQPDHDTLAAAFAAVKVERDDWEAAAGDLASKLEAAERTLRISDDREEQNIALVDAAYDAALKEKS